MFTTSLKKYGQLCIGLYRLHDQDNSESVKRYVITNPPAELRIRSSDYVSGTQAVTHKRSFKSKLKLTAHYELMPVYVLEQFDPGLEYEPGKRQF
ncbi:hypothetical protein ANCCAN_26547 [Ancylostoma caninum]|uniref:Ca2+-activated K+ channel Slowpoke-like C-terminal domain-containing protein n=1 Tax=Ancylostoma caninum TaxID=29170 RepID=A0A368FA23_ANCCA|nr:hypothetical protein ANCCAN_26547 [Ancylostoma caninum]